MLNELRCHHLPQADTLPHASRARAPRFASGVSYAVTASRLPSDSHHVAGRALRYAGGSPCAVMLK